MNLAQLSLRASLLAGRNEAAEAVDPPFPYIGPLRLLRSKVTLQHYLTTSPESNEGAIDMGIAILDCLRGSADVVKIRRELGGAFMSLYVATDDQKHLNQGIVLLRGVYTSNPEHESRRAAYDDLYAALALRYSESKRQEDLEELIHCTQEAFEGSPEGPDKEILRGQLYPLLLSHCTEFKDPHSLETAVAVMPEEDPKFEQILDLFTNWCYSKYKKDGTPAELQKAFENRKRWLALRGVNDPVKRARQLNTLVLHLFEMSNNSPALADLTLGVDWCRESLSIEGSSAEARLQAVMYLSTLLYNRFKVLRDPEDINDGVIAAQEVLTLTDPNSPQYLARMERLMPMLMDRAGNATVLEARKDILEALSLSERILDKCGRDHPQYLGYLCNLGNVHHWCYLYGIQDEAKHLKQSLKFLEAAERDSSASKFRPDVISTLSTTLASMYETTGDGKFLEKGLALQRESIRLREDPISVLHLGGSLRLHYRQTQDLKTLEEAIEVLCRALEISKDSPGTQHSVLRELCGIYHTLFTRMHESSQIQMAIQYGRDGLRLSAASSRDSAKLLDSLSNAYNARFEFEGEPSDLDESIKLLRLAVKDLEDPLVPRYLTSLADRLRLRCFNQHTQRDIEDAVIQCQTALSLLTTTHADYKYALSTMSYVQHELFKMDGKEDRIEKGIKSAKAALPLYSSDDENKALLLDQLRGLFFSKYEKSHSEDDLLKSIEFGREAFASASKTSVRFPTILIHLSFTLYEHVKHFKVDHKDEIRAHLSTLLALPISRPLSRVRSLRILALFSIQEEDWATAFKHLSAAIELYPRISPRAFKADDQQKTIQELSGVTEIAASCALNAGQDPAMALEVLEAGRGIISGWIINARNDVSRLDARDPKLAARYVFLRNLISNEDSTQAMAYSTADANSSLTHRDQWRSYLYELEEIEQTARSKYAGLESFQRALSVDDMKELAATVPIVEINSTALRSDAFIITATGITSLKLPLETRQNMEDITQTIFGPGRLKRSLPQERGKTNAALRTELKWLYENVVCRIMTELCITPHSITTSRRLIWVLNGLASFCPLHAADKFSTNKDECTSAHVISSYIPSLKALQFAREKSFNVELRGHGEVLVVAMPQTKGLTDISADEEAENISSSFSDFPLNSVNVLPNPSRKAVLQGLEGCSVAHFACHGSANSTDPSQSCLLLADSVEPGTPDKLSARDLSMSKRDLAQLCYLSACSTAENSAEILTDENIHVASAFQLSGYSHVIGTLWEAGNRAAVDVAKTFYDSLADAIRRKGGGKIGHDAVAYALHKSVEALKSTKKPRSRLDPRMDVLAWAPFVHLGP
jgi:hypothetical protein